MLVENHSYAHLLVAERYQQAVVLVFLLCAHQVDGEGDHALVVVRQKQAVVLVFLLYAHRVDDEGDRALVDFGDDCRVAH